MSVNAQIRAARDLLLRAKAERDNVEVELGKQHQQKIRISHYEGNDEKLVIEIRELAENLKSIKAPGDAIEIHKLQGELDAERFHKELLEAEMNKAKNSLNSWKQLSNKFAEEKYVLKEEVRKLQAEQAELEEAYSVVTAEVDRQADREAYHIQKITAALSEKKAVLLKLKKELDEANYEVTRMKAEAEYSAICDDFHVDGDLGNIRSTIQSIQDKSPRKQPDRPEGYDAVSEFSLALERLRNSK